MSKFKLILILLFISTFCTAQVTSNARKQGKVSVDKHIVAVTFNDSSAVFKRSDSTSFEVSFNEVSIINGVPTGVIPNVQIIADISTGKPILYVDIDGTGNWLSSQSNIEVDDILMEGDGTDTNPLKPKIWGTFFNNKHARDNGVPIGGMWKCAYGSTVCIQGSLQTAY